VVTLKASARGHDQIKQARVAKGWPVNDFRWMAAASKQLGTDWEQSGVLAPGISEGTWKRFLAGKVAINAAAFQAYCQVLGLDWQTVVEPRGVLLPESVSTEPASLQWSDTEAAETWSLRQDWGNAPDVSVFYGRQEELQTLTTWIDRDGQRPALGGQRCRFITLLGMGGIGKTALATKVARQLVSLDGAQPEVSGAAQGSTAPFTDVFWRSLRNAPPPADILGELLQFLSDQQASNVPREVEGGLLQLLPYLRARRCLVILDNAESILQSGDRTGTYRPGYEGYETLFRGLAETPHQSCVILTAREKPKGLAALEGAALPVRSLQLKGLAESDSKALFDIKGEFKATATEWERLIRRYAGNPLALKIVASSIRDFFGGNISQFLAISQPGGFLFDDIRDLLDQHFQRLTDLERTVMYWLAINREPSTLADLQADLILQVPTRELLESVNSLQRRSLIERTPGGITQQPVVMEYVINQLVDRVVDEICDHNPVLFTTFALAKAQAKEYIRETQVTLILQPIAAQLVNRLGRAEAVAMRLQQLLSTLRGGTPQTMGYAGGNSLNLLLQLPIEISGYDFSELTVWQAYLQDVKLHGVNFAGADLRHCVFTESLGNVLSAAFSPDGQWLATADTDCQVRLWDSQTGHLVRICAGHTNWVRFVTFSPDGQLIASCGADRTIRLWHAADGVNVKTLSGHHHEVFAVAFSPDGLWLASAGGDGTIKVWDISQGTCVHTLVGHRAWVRSVAFANPSTLTGEAAMPHRCLASGDISGEIRLWDVVNERCVQTLTGHQGEVRSLAFSPDGGWLASGSGDGTLKLWDVRTQECLATYPGHPGGVYGVAFNPVEDWLISSGGDRTIKIWDWQTDTCLKTLQGHRNEVCSVAVHPDGRRLVGVSLDQTVKLWDSQTGQCLRTWEGHTDWALPVAFSPEGHYLASGSNDHTVHLWNWQTGDLVRTLTGHRDFIYGVAFSPDGQRLASGSTDCTARIWTVATGQCRQILQGHTDWINAIAFHPQGDILATASADATVKLWNGHTGQCLHTLEKHRAKLLGVTFSPNGEQLASCGSDQVIQLWATATGQPLQTLTGHTSRVWSVAFSPDGQFLASSSTDQTIKVWCLATGQCLQTLIGHTNWVFAVAFSPEGQYLASASHDHTLRIWEVVTGTCLHVCKGHRHLVSSLAFSPEGKAIATGSQDQTVRIWDTDTGACQRVLIAKRLYEGMNLIGATGLTPATLATLELLGAIVA
jgi:WD40 repeat protein